VAITHFGYAHNPADDAALGGPGPIAVTPPASMTAGDLVVLVVQSKTNEDTNMSEEGGQTWNALAHFGAISGSTNRTRMFWCQFNGTWSANPSASVPTDPDAFTITMHVFRPTTGTNTISVDVAFSSQNSGGTPPTGPPYNVTLTGVTTLTDGAVVIAVWSSPDNNTWTISTAGWSHSGINQYRNSFGTDQSHSVVYLVKATVGATGDVTNEQTGASAPDNWHSGIVAFKETAAAVSRTPPTGAVAVSGAAPRMDLGITPPSMVQM
jgi:hypothetical protein